MSGWRLEPVGIAVVLEQVGAHAEGLSTDLTGDGAALADGGASIVGALGWGEWVTASVSQAVQGALGAQAGQVASILNRVDAGRLGVLNAAMAYRDGEVEMAGVFQRATADAAASGDLSFFERYGVV